MKTLHVLELDDKCTMIERDRRIGVTDWPIRVEGLGKLRAAPGGHPAVCTVTFAGTGISAYFAAGAVLAKILALHTGLPAATVLENLCIDCNMTVTLNWCTRRGRLQGKHDGYASYFLLVASCWIYFHHQASIDGPFGVKLGVLKLLPPTGVCVDGRLKW
jgi:hypothetical protein